MKRKIRAAITTIIFAVVLSLMTFAQSSPWTRIPTQGVDNVNDVDVDYQDIWITKTDGTIWLGDVFGANNFVLMPAPVFAVRIAAKDDTVFITTNDGRLFYRDYFVKFSPNPDPGWRQINRPGRFVNDVAVPHYFSVQDPGRLWISETSTNVMAGNNTVKYINAKNNLSEIMSNTQVGLGVVSYTDLSAFRNGVFNGSFTSTNSTGFSRVSAKYGNRNEVWGVGYNGTVWRYDGNVWTRTTAQGMSDVTEPVPGYDKIWVAGKQQYNGTIWCSSDFGLTFRQDPGVQGFQNVASGMDVGANWTIFGAGYNGTLWKRPLNVNPCNP